MARITVEDCMSKIDNQYDLVLLAKERTAQLNAGAEMLVTEDNDKKTIISLREIGDGKILVKDLEKSAILRLRKEPDENLQQEEIEEEENDEFESLYKGQVSKSGIAILPSKRTRKIPDIKKVFTTEEDKSEKLKDKAEEENKAELSPEKEKAFTLKEEVAE
jgi:DNA-directed RNA polymerase subunit omega